MDLLGRRRAIGVTDLERYADFVSSEVEPPLQRVGVPFSETSGVTPGSLRGGGATALYEPTEDIELVRHRGRWQSAKMVEIYVQEVGGHRFFASLAEPTRRRITHLANCQEVAHGKTVELLEKGIPPTNFTPHFSKWW